jgi:hypothetical protein
MMNKLLLFVVLATLGVHPTYGQDRTNETRPRTLRAVGAKEVKAGELVQVGDNLTLKVSQSPKSPFAGIQVKGEPIVVMLELDAGKKSAMLSYNLSADSKASNVYLSNGAQRFAPRAVMDDFPSWGRNNDKEVEVLDPKEADGNVSLKFEGKGAVSLLFDVPATQAKVSKKLSIVLRAGQEQHSFVVNM